MNIRRAHIKDAKKISYLIRKNAEMVEANGYNNAQKKTWADQNKRKSIEEKIKTFPIFCAFQKEQLVGTIGLNKNMLCGMYISYSKRGQGIGNKLVSYLESYAKKKNVRELVLTASPNGYGFYLKNGFKPYGKIELQFDGVKFIETKMKKKL